MRRVRGQGAGLNAAAGGVELGWGKVAALAQLLELAELVLRRGALRARGVAPDALPRAGVVGRERESSLQAAFSSAS